MDWAKEQNIVFGQLESERLRAVLCLRLPLPVPLLVLG